MSIGYSTGRASTPPNMILDDGGDATLYILLGARAEAGEDVHAAPPPMRRKRSRSRPSS